MCSGRLDQWMTLRKKPYGSLLLGIYYTIALFGTKICLEICPLMLSVPRAELEENCELQGADNVQGLNISQEDIFQPKGATVFINPSNVFCNMGNFKNWGISFRYYIHQFQLGMFRHIMHLDQSHVSVVIQDLQ